MVGRSSALLKVDLIQVLGCVCGASREARQGSFREAGGYDFKVQFMSSQAITTRIIDSYSRLIAGKAI